MESECLSTEEAVARLDSMAPNVPLLALGQTVFWDEPMKAGLALAVSRSTHRRRFVAGVHDTDYFAKLPSGERRKGEFKAFPHNGTTTKSLWSAAGEFSALFGSETVISKADLAAAGVRLERVQRSRPGFLDAATEAYGWRGVVSLDDDPPIVRDVPLARVFDPIQKTLNWAIEKSLSCLTEAGVSTAQAVVDGFWENVCLAFERKETGSITDFYVELVPYMYGLAAGEPVDLDATRTSELLKFNTKTCGQARFQLVDRFIRPDSGQTAREAYNEALRGSEIYGLERFGTGAIPFDLVVPGVGRGTIRIGNRGLVISTPKPLFASFKRPIESVADLASIIETRFGADCVLIGKAVTLIGMLATEFCFVFHEGASSYVKYTQAFHQGLEQAGYGLDWHPILRLRYHPWDALKASNSWFKLPKELQPAFGADEICAPSFAARWQGVGQEQKVLIAQLGDLRRPIDLIQFFDEHLGGAWNALAHEYKQLFEQMKLGLDQIESIRGKRLKQYKIVSKAKLERSGAEAALGTHFRERIFEKSPSDIDLQKRRELQNQLDRAIESVGKSRHELKSLLRDQIAIARSGDVQRLHERRRDIELEAELQRIKLVRSAILASTNLIRAGRRPSAWWFPLVSPNGAWWRETIATAQCWFEPLKDSPITSA